MKTIFHFTLRQQLRTRTFRSISAVFAVIAFLLPAVLIPLTYTPPAKGAEKAPDPAPAEADVRPETVYVAADTVSALDFSFLEQDGLPGYEDAAFVLCSGEEDACARAQADPLSLVLRIRETQDSLSYDGLCPKGSPVGTDGAALLAQAAANSSQDLLCRALGLTDAQAQAVRGAAKVRAEAAPRDGDDKPFDPVGFLLPYLNTLLIYFLVLFYGQSVAQSVLLEKTSKLMDTFLVAVRPRSMVYGKLFACCTAAAAQLLLWIACVAFGCAAGFLARSALYPTAPGLSEIAGLVKLIFRYAPLDVLAVSLLLIAAGFLLYCSLSSVGGSLAGKSEDLSSTNQYFTLVLVASFFVTMFATGFMDGTMQHGAAWYDFVPFTAIMITPARIALGYVPVWVGAAACAVTVLLSLAVMTAAGKIYRLMAFYRGEPPKPARLIALLRQR